MLYELLLSAPLYQRPASNLSVIGLRSVMTARGITAQIKLLQATDVPITRQGEYCVVSIGLFLSIASLAQRDAATFLRFMWTDK